MSNSLYKSTEKFEPLVGDKYDLLNRCATYESRKQFVKYRNTVLPGSYISYSDRIRELDVRNDDIWVVTFPKTGTTWVQEMVWLLANNMDYEAARSFIGYRFPFLELSALYDKLDGKCTDSFNTQDFDSISYVTKMSSPRFIKSHLPFELLPEKLQNNLTTKIIYVMRNPGDTCVSYYHHMRKVEGLSASLEEFFQLFMLDQVPYGPYWDHMTGYLKRKHNPNLLILRYEDMKKDLSSTCRKVAKFIEKPLFNDQVEKFIVHLSFENMKRNPAVNYVEQTKHIQKKCDVEPVPNDHIRCGKVGQWEKVLPDKLRERFQNWIRENTLKTGIDFD